MTCRHDGMYDDDYNDEFDESIAANDGAGLYDSGQSEYAYAS